MRGAHVDVLVAAGLGLLALIALTMAFGWMEPRVSIAPTARTAGCRYDPDAMRYFYTSCSWYEREAAGPRAPASVPQAKTAGPVGGDGPTGPARRHSG